MLLTSKFEGLPNVLLEALTLNKFIISSDCPTGPNEILDNGKGGFLFKVGNFTDLAKNILIHKSNHKLSLQKKKFAISRLDRFNFKNNLKLYFELFKDL